MYLKRKRKRKNKVDHFDFKKLNQIKTFKKRIKFCKERLKKIGKGRNRIVFYLEDNKVLKLSINKNGIAQTKVECNPDLQSKFSEMVAKIFDYDPEFKWVIMEKAERINDKIYFDTLKHSYDEVAKYFFILHNEKYFKKNNILICPIQKKQFEEYKEKFKNSLYVQKLKKIYDYFDLEFSADFFKNTSYGIVIRNNTPQLVLIDCGFAQKHIN